MTYKNSFLKVVILGDSGVGKSCLLTRFVSNTFSNSFHTIGVEFMNKEVCVDGDCFTLQIWDTAGQERFKSLRAPFYRGSDICLLTFAVDDRVSFYNLTEWKKEFLRYADVKDERLFPFVVVANKIDKDNREVGDSEISAWCKQNGNLTCVETSAKEGINVDKAFETAVNSWLQIVSDILSNDAHLIKSTFSVNNFKPSSRACC